MRPRTSRIRSSSRSICGFVLLVACLVSSTKAQIGEDVCSCSPAAYTFEFDFSITCPPVNITQGAGSGIKDTSCFVVDLGGGDVQDLVPVSVQSIQIIELNRMSQPLVKPTNIMGSFVDGDSFSFTSVSAGVLANISDVPGGIQMTTTGMNALNETLSVLWSITFTNECGIEPIFQVGMSAGWTVFENLIPPRQEYCPGATTLAPTDSPLTDAPTAMPVASEAPTAVPVATAAPTMMPVAPITGPPTTVPVTPPITDPPTTVPVTGPPTGVPVTDPPTGPQPTLAPVAPPTGPPPTLAPVAPPTGPPPTLAPVAPPTGPPPTLAPVAPPTGPPPTLAPVAPPTGPPPTLAPVAPPTGPQPTLVPVAPPTGPQPTLVPVAPQAPSPRPDTPMPVTPGPTPTHMSMSMSMSFDYRRMEEVMNEAELFEFGRAA